MNLILILHSQIDIEGREPYLSDFVTTSHPPSPSSPRKPLILGLHDNIY